MGWFRKQNDLCCDAAINTVGAPSELHVKRDEFKSLLQKTLSEIEEEKKQAEAKWLYEKFQMAVSVYHKHKALAEKALTKEKIKFDYEVQNPFVRFASEKSYRILKNDKPVFGVSNGYGDSFCFCGDKKYLEKFFWIVQKVQAQDELRSLGNERK